MPIDWTSGYSGGSHGASDIAMETTMEMAWNGLSTTERGRLIQAALEQMPPEKAATLKQRDAEAFSWGSVPVKLQEALKKSWNGTRFA